MSLCLSAYNRACSGLDPLLRSIAYSLGLVVLIASAVSSTVNAQTSAHCPLVGEVPLKQVTVWIATNSESRTVTLIQTCHMGFQLDASALNTLSKTKASPAVLDALDKVTTVALSVDQAHAQAEALQSQLSAANAGQVALYRRHIDSLEHATYVDLNSATFGSYDPKSSRLTATIGGDQYWFDTVTAQSEETVFKSWYRIKVMRPYADDARHTRLLVLTAISLSGYSRKADVALRLAPLLSEAQARMDRGDYAGAKEKYEAALDIDSNNSVAVDGSKLADGRIEERIKKSQGEIAIGEWTDDKTGLMWTIKGEDGVVPFKRALAFCQNLRLGGHDDWRLPNKEELVGIFEAVPVNQKTFRWTLDTYTYYIRGGQIQLTRPSVWSSTLEKQGSKNAWFVNMSTGQSDVHYGIGVPGLEALCVRGKPDNHQDPVYSAIDADVFNKTLSLCNRGNAEMCAFVGKNYEEGKLVSRDYDKAMEFYHKGCKMGESAGCDWADDLVKKLNKQANQK